MALQYTIHRAARSGDLEALQSCFENMTLEERREIVTMKYKDITPLMHACVAGHVPVVKFLIEECQADVEQTGTLLISGATPLLCAVIEGQDSVVTYLLEKQVDVNKSGCPSMNPLFAAIFCGRDNIARALIENGADVHRKNDVGSTVVHACAFYPQIDVEVMELLLKNKADVTVTNNFGHTPLILAASEGNGDKVSLIRKYLEERVSKSKTEQHVSNPETEEHISKSQTEEMINVIELLGAAMIDTKRDLQAGMQLWKQAFQDRLNYGIPKVIVAEPKDVFRYAVEAQNVEEIECLENDPDALRIQAMLIRERIIGKYRLMLNHIDRNARIYEEEHDLTRAAELRIYALKIRQTEDDPFDGYVQICFEGIVDLFLRLWPNVGTRLAMVAQLFNLLLGEFTRGQRMSGSETCQNACTKLFPVAVLVIRLLCALEECWEAWDREASEGFRASLSSFAAITFRMRGHNDYTLLHYACENPALKFTLPNAVHAFMDTACEGFLDTPDADGNTPLHVAARKRPFDRSVIDDLLKAGAHVDLVNHEGNTFEAYCPDGWTLQHSLLPLSLRCLATRAVRRYKLNYQDFHFPSHLIEFIERH